MRGPAVPPARAGRPTGHGHLPVDTQITRAGDLAPEPSLDLSCDVRGLTERATLAGVGGLGPELGRVVGYLVLDAVARNLAHAAVVLLGLARMRGALTEQLARPRRRLGDIALGESVT
jgi:hypothetical protein